MGYEIRNDFCAMTGKSHVEKVPLRRQQNKLKASKMNEAKILFRLYIVIRNQITHSFGRK